MEQLPRESHQEHAYSHTVTTTSSSFVATFTSRSNTLAYDKEFLKTIPGVLMVVEIVSLALPRGGRKKCKLLGRNKFHKLGFCNINKTPKKACILTLSEAHFCLRAFAQAAHVLSLLVSMICNSETWLFLLTLLTRLLGFEMSILFLALFPQGRPQIHSAAKIASKKGHLAKSQEESLNLSSLLPLLKPFKLCPFAIFISFHITFLSFTTGEASKFRRMF
uniref:Transmembrane protein n=1 Tax=Laticauda laticaudata TaxID=8630 RepID=A0A8C5RY00_LATLA